MSETPSVMIPIGTKMPSFTLPDAHGTPWSPPEDHEGILVIFMCNHCPFVLHIADALHSIYEACRGSGNLNGWNQLQRC